MADEKFDEICFECGADEDVTTGHCIEVGAVVDDVPLCAQCRDDLGVD